MWLELDVYVIKLAFDLLRAFNNEQEGCVIDTGSLFDHLVSLMPLIWCCFFFWFIKIALSSPVWGVKLMLVFGTLHLMIFPWISVDVYSELGDTFCRTQKFCFVGVVHLLAFQSVILIHEWDCFFLLFITKIKSATFQSKDLLIFFCLFNYLVRNQPGGFITVDYLKLFIHYI